MEMRGVSRLRVIMGLCLCFLTCQFYIVVKLTEIDKPEDEQVTPFYTD